MINLIKKIFDFNKKERKKSEKGEFLKHLFLTYFDGSYGYDPKPNTPTTYQMGVCKLEYDHKENELIVHLRRPGVLIGKGGRTIKALAKELNCKIGIKEVKLV